MNRSFAFLATWLFLFTSPSSGSIGWIVSSAGAAVLLRAEQVLAPTPETALQINDILRTEKGGLVKVVLTDGSVLLLAENTELRVIQHDPETQQTSIELLRGHVFAQNTPVTKSGGKFLILTPTAMVMALGTSLEVQTTGQASGTALGGDTQLAVQENGTALAGAEVALVLANMNKVSIGKTDEQGTPNSALELANNPAVTQGLDLANLGKVPLHAEVDECEDGSKQVYLIGPGGKLPPLREHCKRKRLEGIFYWGKAQRVSLDVARGTSIATDLPAGSGAVTATGAAVGPTSLTDIPAGATPGPKNPMTLASYTDVGTTIVRALDHFVGIANIDTNIPGSTYLLPGQGTIVGRGQAPDPATVTTERDAWQKILQRHWRAEAQHIYELGLGPHTMDFDNNGRACQPGMVINGVLAEGTTATFRYKITGLGTSTGNALQLQVWNDGTCPLYFLVTDGTIFHPKGFTERVLTGILLGGTPSLKDFQKMISMGGFLRVVPAGSLASGPAAPAGGEASMPLRSYCVELHKLAPHPKTEYKFGDEGDQKSLGANRAVVDRTFSMVQTHQLSLPKEHSMDTAIQWSLWSKIEGMGEKQFMDEFTKLVHKNYETQKKKWDKPAQQLIQTTGQSLWQVVSKILK